MKIAAIYARVSSDQQKEENTIASQTAALVEFAREQGFSVPDEWVIEDEGFSGASLLRPGLERLRDLAAEGQIQTVLIHAPDRLSRKYAYQVLLTEEFARHGVETIFIKAPHAGTPEDQLMLQFQGMIAEYERAQILERSRRGKRHRAKAGEVSVLGGAPYGYRYIRKTPEMPARYEIDATEAAVVRLIFDKYTVEGLSIGAIARLLREMAPPTRKRVTRWERSVVWGMLRNPAYKGTACFNKTKVGPRQKVTKPFRLSGRAVHGEKTCAHERPREEWIEIPVPALVSEETFALAAERLADNKRFAPRRTIEPSLVQGLVSCKKCGYALYRTSTRSSARKIHYYRCLGSDGWRHLGGSVCDSRPIRQDLLDHIVWQEVIWLIEDPGLITAELDRRLDAARASEPTKKRQDAVERDLTRVGKGIERLLTAYQEDLLSLDELRRRMPELRACEQGLRAELQAIRDQAADRMSFLRLAETLTAFLQRLRQSAETLDICDRQRIARLLVKEVLVDDDTITIRHSIPAQPTTPPTGSEPPSSNGNAPSSDRSYLLRSESNDSYLRYLVDAGVAVQRTYGFVLDGGLVERWTEWVLADAQRRAVFDHAVKVATWIIGQVPDDERRGLTIKGWQATASDAGPSYFDLLNDADTQADISAKLGLIQTLFRGSRVNVEDLLHLPISQEIVRRLDSIAIKEAERKAAAAKSAEDARRGRYDEIGAEAAKLFGGSELEWLKIPNERLEGRTPLEAAARGVHGLAMAKEILHQIERQRHTEFEHAAEIQRHRDRLTRDAQTRLRSAAHSFLRDRSEDTDNLPPIIYCKDEKTYRVALKALGKWELFLKAQAIPF